MSHRFGEELGRVGDLRGEAGRHGMAWANALHSLWKVSLQSFFSSLIGTRKKLTAAFKSLRKETRDVAVAESAKFLPVKTGHFQLMFFWWFGGQLIETSTKVRYCFVCRGSTSALEQPHPPHLALFCRIEPSGFALPS